MITKLKLSPLKGGESFFIFDVQTAEDSDYLSAQTYLAQQNYPAGTAFTFRSPRATYTYELREAVFEGAHSYPGDPEQLGRLTEPLLLLQIDEVNHADEKSST